MVRLAPFLPLISTAALLASPTAAAAGDTTPAIRQESYAAVLLPQRARGSSYYPTRRQLLTCEQTYGPGWKVCGDVAESSFCYNPGEGQICCSQDAGYCDAGTWCAPVAGFCCLDGEDVATCAAEDGFDLPGATSSSSSSSGSVSTTVLSTGTTTRSSTTVVKSSTTTSTTLSSTVSSSALSSSSSSWSSSGSDSNTTANAGLPTSCTAVGGGGLTWTSVYPATITPSVNRSDSTNSTASAAVPSSTYVQISVAQKEQWTLMWMTVAMGVVGLFMATC